MSQEQPAIHTNASTTVSPSVLLAMGPNPLSSNIVVRVDDYELYAELGRGLTSKVYLGRHSQSGEKVAAKAIRKKYSSVAPLPLTPSSNAPPSMHSSKYEVEEGQVEKEIMKILNHPNLIQLKGFKELESEYFLFIEYAEGGNLLQYVKQKKKLDEAESRGFFAAIVDGIDFCHKRKIIHRDIKLENILLTKDSQIKICDFGFATFWSENILQHKFCGSLHYSAPEILTATPYLGPPSDIWSLGVLLFAMLAGRLPFYGPKDEDVYFRIMTLHFTIPDYVSREAQHLVKKILKINSKERLPMDQIRLHPWIVAPTRSVTTTAVVTSSSSSPSCPTAYPSVPVSNPVSQSGPVILLSHPAAAVPNSSGRIPQKSPGRSGLAASMGAIPVSPIPMVPIHHPDQPYSSDPSQRKQLATSDPQVVLPQSNQTRKQRGSISAQEQNSGIQSSPLSPTKFVQFFRRRMSLKEDEEHRKERDEPNEEFYANAVQKSQTSKKRESSREKQKQLQGEMEREERERSERERRNENPAVIGNPAEVMVEEVLWNVGDLELEQQQGTSSKAPLAKEDSDSSSSERHGDVLLLQEEIGSSGSDSNGSSGSPHNYQQQHQQIMGAHPPPMTHDQTSHSARAHHVISPKIPRGTSLASTLGAHANSGYSDGLETGDSGSYDPMRSDDPFGTLSTERKGWLSINRFINKFVKTNPRRHRRESDATLLKTKPPPGYLPGYASGPTYAHQGSPGAYIGHTPFTTSTFSSSSSSSHSSNSPMEGVIGYGYQTHPVSPTPQNPPTYMQSSAGYPAQSQVLSPHSSTAGNAQGHDITGTRKPKALATGSQRGARRPSMAGPDETSSADRKKEKIFAGRRSTLAGDGSSHPF